MVNQQNILTLIFSNILSNRMRRVKKKLDKKYTFITFYHIIAS